MIFICLRNIFVEEFFKRQGQLRAKDLWKVKILCLAKIKNRLAEENLLNRAKRSFVEHLYDYRSIADFGGLNSCACKTQFGRRHWRSFVHLLPPSLSVPISVWYRNDDNDFLLYRSVQKLRDGREFLVSYSFSNFQPIIKLPACL